MRPRLAYFLQNETTLNDFRDNGGALRQFVDLDDNDIWLAIKVWTNHRDSVLSTLSNGMTNRRLFKIEITPEAQSASRIQQQLQTYVEKYGISEQEAAYFISSDVIATDMYTEKDDSIDILYKDGSAKDISIASDMLNIELLSKKVRKYYFAYLSI